jgi:hypothetical protein
MFNVKDCLEPTTDMSELAQFVTFNQELFCQFRPQVGMAQRNKSCPVGQILRDRIFLNPANQMIFGRMFQNYFRIQRSNGCRSEYS